MITWILVATLAAFLSGLLVGLWAQFSHASTRVRFHNQPEQSFVGKTSAELTDAGWNQTDRCWSPVCRKEAMKG